MTRLNLATVGDDGKLPASQIPATVLSASSIQTVALNGATDGGQINAALAALGGPGVVFLSGLAGGIDQTVVIDTAQHLCYLGRGVCTLKLNTGVNDDVVRTKNFATLTGTNSASGPSGFGLHNLILDGNYAHNTAGWAFRCYGSDYDVDNVVFQHGASGGVWSEWGTGGTNMEARWHRFRIYNNKNVELDWNGPHDSQFSQGIVNVDGVGPSGVVFGIRTRGNAAGELFGQVHTWGPFTGFGWYCEAFAVAQNCYAEGAGQGAVMLGASQSRWHGYVHGNSTGKHGVQVGDDNAWGGGVSHTGLTGVALDVTIDKIPFGAYPIYSPPAGSGGGNRYRAMVALGGRLDSCNTANNSDVVVDASITLADQGQPVAGPGIPYDTYVGTVTAGVSFLLSSSSSSQVNVNAYLTQTGRNLMIGGSGKPMSSNTPNTGDQFEVTVSDFGWLSYFAEQGGGASNTFQTSTQQGRKFYGPVEVISPSSQALRVNSGTTDIFYVSGAGLVTQLPNGCPLDGYKDSFTTKTLRINPSNGAVQPGTASGVGGQVFSGSGAPAVSASLGDRYIRTDTPAALGTLEYVCTTASSATAGAWTPVNGRHPTIMMPTAKLAETYPRQFGVGNLTGMLVSQQQSFMLIYLTAGMTVSTIEFVAGGTLLSNGVHQWFSLYTLALGLLGTTADDTTTGWAAFATKTLTMSSAYPVTASGLYYVGCMVNAGTVPTLSGISVNGSVAGQAPILLGRDTTNNALTDPASAPSPAAALTAVGGSLYAAIG